jgi:hypothetical protein
MDNEEMQKMIKSIQTSLHDQVSALKSDVQKAVGDADTALEISATLEKTIHELESGKYEIDKLIQGQTNVLKLMSEGMQEIRFATRKVRVLTGMNHICLSLCTIGIAKTLATPNNVDKQRKYLEQVLKLLKIHDDFALKIDNATEVEQVNSLGEHLLDKYMDVQSAILGSVKSLP